MLRESEQVEVRAPADEAPLRDPDPPAADRSAPLKAAASRRRRRTVRRALLTLAPLLVIAAAAYLYLTGGRYVGTDNAYVKVDTVSVSPEVSGPIVAVDVAENQRVTAGQALFRIDDAPFRLALARAEAQLQSTRTDIESLKASYRQKQAEIALARTNEAYAKQEFDRQAALVQSNAVSRARYDEARHNFDAARQQIAVVQQQLAQILAQLAGEADIAAEAHPSYLNARAERDRAALDLARTVVRASIPGIAGRKPVVGQYVKAGDPAMTVVADRNAWIEANFKETDLTYVRPGQTVTIAVDTYPGHALAGTVESISQATGAEFAILPPQNATGNWVKVVQRIPVRIAVAVHDGDPPLRAGMSTDVEIDTGRRRALPAPLRTALHWIDGAFGTAFAAAPRS
jgi:membrane fusion protein (multidrug efflux system)